MDDNKKIWSNVLTEVELEVSKGNFSMWFKDTSILKQDDGVIYLSVPNVFVKDWLLNKYHKILLIYRKRNHLLDDILSHQQNLAMIQAV